MTGRAVWLTCKSITFVHTCRLKGLFELYNNTTEYTDRQLQTVSPTQHKSALEIDYKGEKGLACGKKKMNHINKEYKDCYRGVKLLEGP